MIRNLVLVSSSGMVVFVQDFLDPVPQARMVGSLLTVMLEFAHSKLHSRVAFLEYKNVAISIVMDERAKLNCLLFHDVEDGRDFGKLLASRILSSFVHAYLPKDFSESDSVMWSSYSARSFKDFHSKLPEIVGTCIPPILEKLVSTKGIILCVAVRHGDIVYSTGQIDRLGFGAHLQAMTNASSDLLSFSGDDPVEIVLDTESMNIRVIRLLAGLSLVVVMEASAEDSQVEESVEQARKLLMQMDDLVENLSARR